MKTVFEPTEMLHKGSRAQSQASRVPTPDPKFLADDLEENPLLSPEEILEEMQQKIKSAFLIGLVIGAGSVGGFFLGKWMWDRFLRSPSTTLGTTTATTLPMEEMVNLQ